MAKTKKVETTVEQKLRALYDLQIIDSRLDEIRNTRGELPLEVEDLEDDVHQLQARIQKTEEEIKEVEEQIKNRKELIKNCEALVKKYTKQQDNVRNNREFEALSKEIEYQGLEIELAEKHIRQFQATIANKTELIKGRKADVAKEITEIKGFEAQLEELQNHLTHKKNELADIINETEKEEKVLLEKGEEFAASIDERLLKAYRKIRASVKNGLAIVPVERGASAGSYFTIPPQRQTEIAQRKKVITDEHSGRILVDAALAEEELEKMKAVIG